MYDVFIGYDGEGHETWVDYEWLHKGCINEQYFNWMYSNLTAQNPNIRELHNEGTQFRQFTSSAAYNDMVSHEKKWELIDIEKFRRMDLTEYIKQKWGI